MGAGTVSKVWTSGAATADYALMIARTHWDVPKHRGLSYFAVPENPAPANTAASSTRKASS
jgi:alkylation response protein AidB-like acyl-CoA dehydrogenase